MELAGSVVEKYHGAKAFVACTNAQLELGLTSKKEIEILLLFSNSFSDPLAESADLFGDTDFYYGLTLR